MPSGKRAKGFEFSGKVTGEPPVYAVVGYLDPEGGSDYDATTTTAVPDKEGRFTLDCQALVAGKKGCAARRLPAGEWCGLRVPVSHAVSLSLRGRRGRHGGHLCHRSRIGVQEARSKDAKPGAGPAATSGSDPAALLKQLIGTEWQLQDLCGETVITNSRASLAFAADGAISGNGSINRFNGRITVEETTLKVGPLASTKMAGPPAAMAQESKYLKALRSATAIRWKAIRSPSPAPIPGSP